MRDTCLHTQHILLVGILCILLQINLAVLEEWTCGVLIEKGMDGGPQKIVEAK
jgi:hypothetical protein